MFMKTAKMITDDLHDIKKIFFFFKIAIVKKKKKFIHQSNSLLLLAISIIAIRIFFILVSEDQP